MELEHMRRVLAEKAMEWTPVRQGRATWYDTPDKSWRVKQGPTAQLSRVSADWQPDKDGNQMLLVIEAMTRKRFLVHMSIYTWEDGAQAANATCSRFTPGPPAEHIHATSESLSDSIPLVACEAMARALEATNEVS